MIKVLVDAGNASRHSGTGVYAYGLLDALQRFGQGDITAADSGISMASSRLRPLWRLAYMMRLRSLARGGFHGSDVVHFANIYAPPKAHGVAYVVTVHDIDPVEFPDLHSSRFRLYFDRAVRKAGQRANVILTDTQAVRERILDRYQLPESRVAAVGIGLNPTFVNAFDAITAAPPEGVPMLLFVGRLLRKKNITWTVKSVVEGVRSGALPRMKIVIAGNRGDAVPEISPVLRDADGLAAWSENPDMRTLAALYRASAAVVLPSHTEGFGLPLIEAMYCCKPIVASRIPTSLEVAGKAANFFTLGNREEFFVAVRAAVESGTTQEQRRAAEERLAAYAWASLVKEYQQIYHNALTMAQRRV